MKANRIRICGRNTITPPSPAMMPSTSRLLSGPRGSALPTTVAQRAGAGLDQVHQRRRPGVHRLEDQEHHHRQRQQAEHRMQQPAIERVVDRGGTARHRHRQRQQAAGFGVQVGGSICACRPDARAARAARPAIAVQLRHQRPRAVAAHRHGRHHRHAEFALQRGEVDVDAAAPGRIHHVDREHHRLAELAHFQREAQVQAQVGGVDHADDHVRRRLARVEAAAQVAGDRLVQAGGMEAVGARQVQHRVVLARRRVEAAFLALDGDAGVVGDLLPAAGEQVEQRGLAAVRDCRPGPGGRRRRRSCDGSRQRFRQLTCDARRFGAAQREPGETDLHQQRLGAHRAGGHALRPARRRRTRARAGGARWRRWARGPRRIRPWPGCAAAIRTASRAHHGDRQPVTNRNCSHSSIAAAAARRPAERHGAPAIMRLSFADSGRRPDDRTRC